jgi:dehydrogenase/reductase SDR family protein 4
MASGLAKLAGKVAVVTASTEGIGFAIARRLAQDGAKVMLSSRKQQNVDRAVKELRAENLNVEGIVCHVSKKEDRQRLFKETTNKFGGIDILVSNAAVSTYFGPTLKTPEDAFDKMFEVNVKSSFLLCQEVVPEMEKRGAGSVVIVASIAAYVPFELIGIYSITKTALVGMVKVLAPELGAKNIRINGLAPGIIKTKFSSALTSNQEVQDATVGKIPLGRLGETQDCAGAVSFLTSDDSAWVTGETIVVAGGVTSRL